MLWELACWLFDEVVDYEPEESDNNNDRLTAFDPGQPG